MKTFIAILLAVAFFRIDARTLVVSKIGELRSISVALARAAAGDTILVKPGEYREGNIVLRKSICLIGEGYPVLDGEHRYEILTIHADNVTVRGFHFARTGIASIQDLAGIKVLDSKFLHVIDNIFSEAFFGIHMSNSANCRIENNRMKSDIVSEHQIGNGIHLWKCDQVTIRNNRIAGHRDGIYFEFVTNSLIIENHSEQNLRYGLHFMFSHDNEYHDNTFLNNGAGVAVMYTTGVKMIGNRFDHNWGSSAYGLLLKDIRDSEVRGNTFRQNSVGIYMEGSSRIQFIGNDFSQNGYAVKIQASCDGNAFSGNNFSANTFDMATNGTLVLNEVRGNYWDKYQGYDLDRNGTGDVPFHPVSMYSMVVEQIPAAVLLWRSFLVLLMDRAEKAVPAMTPENLKDDLPSMQPYDLHTTSN